MKKYLTAVLLSLSLVSIPVLNTGCEFLKGTSTNRVVYNTLYTVGNGVNSGYSAYLDQVVRGQAVYSVNVAKAYNEFQAAYSAAVITASQNLNALAPQNVIDLANAFYAAVKQFQK